MISGLTAQLNELREQLASLQSRLDSPSEPLSSAESASSDDDVWTMVSHSKKRSFAAALQQTVTTALREERVNCDVIVSKAPELDNDTVFVNDLCTKMNFSSRPRDPVRLGKKTNDRPRLLKMTFPTAFDARSFMARYDQARRSKTEGLPSLRLRPSMTKEERAKFAKSSKLVFDLNTKAKRDDLPESYSLRDDGSVWKFFKTDDGKWRRDRNWVLEEPKNESSAPLTPTPAST